MASQWAQTQRSGWLSKLYGQDNGQGQRELPEQSVQAQLVDILANVLSGAATAEECANKTASVVLSQRDVGTPVSNLAGLFTSAVEEASDNATAQRLVDYVVALARLPDAVNDGAESKSFTVGSEATEIAPGQPLRLDSGRLWRDLPDFSMNLTESFQGPELYLAKDVSHKEAASKWSNLNTYVAVLASDSRAREIPALANTSTLGFKTLAMALEHPPDSRLGRNTALHVPAASQWLRIANEPIENACNHQTERFEAGELWKAQGGSDQCDPARLQFWKSRLSELES